MGARSHFGGSVSRISGTVTRTAARGRSCWWRVAFDELLVVYHWDFV